MSALALFLASKGHKVSGSDSRKNKTCKELVSKGIKIFTEQGKDNLQSVSRQNQESPLIITSTAIQSDNPELQAARDAKLPIWHRSDLLAVLTNEQPSIAVGGTHGKTTTSAMVATLLAATDNDPSALVGGIIPWFNTNGHSGNGRYLIAEADESDGSLVKLNPEIGLITNIEMEHTDHYSKLSDLLNTMKIFGKRCQNLLVNYDCPNISSNLKSTKFWSIKQFEGIDFSAIPILIDGEKTVAKYYEKGELLGEIILPIPGIHNLSNATGALAACRLAGVEFYKLKEALIQLKTPKRRFEFLGIWENRQIVDDYAHHPSEIKATLRMAELIIKTKKSALPKSPKRIFLTFQPHRFSRTEKFLKELAQSLSKADYIVLTPIYSAGEKAIENVNSEILADEIKKINPKIPIKVAKNLEDLTKMVRLFSKEDDLIISMGAGSINSLWDRLNIGFQNNRDYSQLAA